MADKGMPSIQDWRTPPLLAAALKEEFSFSVDVAATCENRIASFWLGEDSIDGEDGLVCSWSRGLSSGYAYCNPPYNNTGAWLKKGVEELDKGVGSVFLIPAAVELKYWAETVWKRAAEVRLVTGRLAFIHPISGEPMKGNRYNSAIVIFRPNWPGREPHVYRVDHYWEE